VEKIRYDKDWSECLSYNEMKSLTADLKKKVAINSDDDEEEKLAEIEAEIEDDQNDKNNKKKKGPKKNKVPFNNLLE
jgi:hypothetical protein